MSHELTEATIRDWWNDDDEACSWKALDLGEMIALNRVARAAYDLGKAAQDDGFFPDGNLANVRRGDILRRAWFAGGVAYTTEGIADQWQSGMYWVTKEGTPIVGGSLLGQIFRKPAEVTPPDPEKHPIILAGNGKIWQAVGRRYYVPGVGMGFAPEDFGDKWRPAKIVADTEEN